ncbi:hypothetical protein KP509_34G013300 [Ceratopteris richardii]|uniref:Beta-amylase n=1 Tax=Ceratopteris richardii TaxID=49495 RepID=A0A8T2QJ42_CERRI|nr:hypothetical protein KP509_34G013300 [Ceratopteris richardii]
MMVCVRLPEAAEMVRFWLPGATARAKFLRSSMWRICLAFCWTSKQQRQSNHARIISRRSQLPFHQKKKKHGARHFCRRGFSVRGLVEATKRQPRSIVDVCLPCSPSLFEDGDLFLQQKVHRDSRSVIRRGPEAGVPVYVMLPLDSINPHNNTINRRRAMDASLLALKSAGVEGVMLDVWWGR